jgi:hypothetical protein
MYITAVNSKVKKKFCMSATLFFYSLVDGWGHTLAVLPPEKTRLA